MKVSDLRFDDQGLIPTVVQSDADGRVLMVAYMNSKSVQLTLESNQMHFFSRSRSEIWPKGATSGNTQDMVSLSADCDGDSLLAVVREAGVSCHTGKRSCFENFEPLELP